MSERSAITKNRKGIYLPEIVVRVAANNTLTSHCAKSVSVLYRADKSKRHYVFLLDTLTAPNAQASFLITDKCRVLSEIEVYMQVSVTSVDFLIFLLFEKEKV